MDGDLPPHSPLKGEEEMSTKISCDRCRVKEGSRKHKETPFKMFNIDLCDMCNSEVDNFIKLFLLHRNEMDNSFAEFILNPQPGAKDAIMGKYGFGENDI